TEQTRQRAGVGSLGEVLVLVDRILDVICASEAAPLLLEQEQLMQLHVEGVLAQTGRGDRDQGCDADDQHPPRKMGAGGDVLGLVDQVEVDHGCPSSGAGGWRSVRVGGGPWGPCAATV